MIISPWLNYLKQNKSTPLAKLSILNINQAIKFHKY